MNVLRVDIDAPAANLVAARFGNLRGTPTYILVDGRGREVWRQVGGAPDRGVVESYLARMR